RRCPDCRGRAPGDLVPVGDPVPVAVGDDVERDDAEGRQVLGVGDRGTRWVEEGDGDLQFLNGVLKNTDGPRPAYADSPWTCGWRRPSTARSSMRCTRAAPSHQDRYAISAALRSSAESAPAATIVDPMPSMTRLQMVSESSKPDSPRTATSSSTEVATST